MIFTLASLALAAPQSFTLTLDAPPADPVADYDELLEQAAALAPPGVSHIEVAVRGTDGALVPLRDLLPPITPPPAKPGEGLRSLPVDNPGAAQGSLNGKGIYLSQCHGWIWYDTLGRFSTQRGVIWDTVEDFHNPEAMNQFLTAYLENAGGSVFTVKERDLNPAEASVDDGDSGYSESGAGFTDGPTGWGDGGVLPYGENPFTSGGTRSFPSNGGGVATWVPDVPADGWYPIYVSWSSEDNAATDAHYRLVHPGGVIDRTFDQRVHGYTWQYVDTLWLPEGSGGLRVELVADSSDSGRLVNADAVRIGGGMGLVSRHSVTTGRPRWEEGAILGTQFNGAPTSVYDPYGSGNGSDPASRSRWAAWEHPLSEDAVYVSWHSNAFDGSARGTSTYTYAGSAVSGSVDLADYVQDELMTAARLWDASWQDRGLKTADFSEVNPNNNPEMPAILIEHGFHDNEDDTWAIKQPEFRRDSARALYRGIVAYFAHKDGGTPHYLPEPPTAVSVVESGSGELVASWRAGPTGAPMGDAATSYLVYTSRDGRAWDHGTPVSGTSYTLPTGRGHEVYVRVAGVNQGGVSFPSEVVGARRSADGEVPVLVVGAFDRMDSGLLNWEDTIVGDVVRMDLRHMNAYDTSVAAGRAIGAAKWPFSTVSDEAFEGLDLSPYALVVWLAGEESTEDESVSSAQQTKLRAFVSAGGALWVSGAEVLWDLDYKGSTTDKAFAAEVLGATMADDDAGTDRATGAGSLASVGTLDFGVIDGAPYPVEWPDTLQTSGEVIATYSGGAVAGALTGRVAMFGFPFESIGSDLAREELAAALLPLLVPDYEPVDVVDPEDTGLDDTGLDDTGVDPDDTSDPEGRVGLGTLGGCGCTTPAGVVPVGAWLLALGLGWVRRRRSA
ncbi:MAG: N-acetylmuramoyl-L-alanine amidase [Deltaproteobacteria bacterium]|nr:N-acetylmuramoyl-L-alanine amidase [Deltaproteobacteria bacterium]